MSCVDFNINFLNYESHNPTQSFTILLLSLTFRPLIKMPARITESSSADNIFTNGLSDHNFLPYFIFRR